MASKKLPGGVTQRADGVLEKTTPHFDLSQIKRVVAQHGPKCFFKSMTSYHDTNLWQDVYRVPTPKGDAYVKFQWVQPPPVSSFLPKLVIQFKAK